MKFWTTLFTLVFLPSLLLSENHLLISEIQVSPDSAEFVEIFNPNASSLALDHLYLSDYKTYYEMVNGVYSSVSSDFLVKFPAGATIDAAGVIVVAMDGNSVSNADYEIKSVSSVPDMEPLYVGSSASLSNLEMLMLFSWDGQSSTVQDVDYAMWGSTTSNFVDKSAVPGYLPDTPVGNQDPFNPAPVSGKTMTRISVGEAGEIFTGGNGITGHNETSEPIGQNFTLQDPTPGTTDLQVPTGDGSGIAYVLPNSVRADTTLSLAFVIKGTASETVTSISLAVPTTWGWSSSSGDVQLSGPAFSGASPSVNGNVVSLTSAQLTAADSGVVTISSLTSPAQPEQSVFEIQTATAGGNLTAIGESPAVTVYRPSVAATIADIQANPSNYTSVTIEAIVTVGREKLSTTQLDAYVQDNSGRGINVFSFDPPENFPGFERGKKLRITGTVTEYIHSTRFDHTTEITDFTYQVLDSNQTLPAPLQVSTIGATDTSLEGTMVEATGTITDMYYAGGGNSIVINDGSGEVTVRVWDATQINVSGFQLNDVIMVKGVVDSYNLEGQILPAYQEDISLVTSNPGDGTGTATVTPDSVGIGQSGQSLEFTISGDAAYTLTSISLDIPTGWQWSGTAQIGGTGFAGANLTVQGNKILVDQASVTQSSAGMITVQGLTAPAENAFSTFNIKTATSGGVLTAIQNSPRVKVGIGVNAVPISEIQLHTSNYVNQQVTIMGVVTMGAGITIDTRTDAYIQDNSGYGINVYQYGTVDSRLERGNLVVINGTILDYQGTTEITDYTLEVLSRNNALPTPLNLSTSEATDIQWEGVYVKLEGVISDLYSAGGGANVVLDDGSGPCTVRIWDTSNLNLSSFAIGDTIIALGIDDIYNGAGQVVVGYQQDIYKPGSAVSGDGGGFALADRDTISPGETGVAIAITLWSNEADTLQKVQIGIPFNWAWSGSKDDVLLSGKGLEDASKKVVLEYGQFWIELTGCNLTAADSGYVTIQNMSATSSHVYSYFWIKTAVQEKGTPQFISKSPQIAVGQNPYWLISDLQTNSAQFKDTVTVRGVTTIGAGVLRTDRTSAYVQDESGYGINVSKSGTPDTVNFRRGYFVRFSGLVSEYQRTTQILPIQIDSLYLAPALPEAVELSTQEAKNARWDGTLIQVPNISAGQHAIVTESYTTSSQAPYDYNITVNDGTGSLTLRVWGTTGINLDSISVNKAIIAKGVGSIFGTSYQILPAYQDDIRIDANYQASLEKVSLDVPPHPFVPDMGENITIHYNAGSIPNHVTLRIFDLGGRLVTTLLDEDAELVENELQWDGRDEYRDFVPLGTYICHLEVMERVSGKRKVKRAPIVVGTRLKK